MNIKDLDTFRVGPLVILCAGLILAAWHISWLHKQSGLRYEMQSGDYGRIYVLDRQERVVYTGQGGFGEEPIVWHASTGRDPFCVNHSNIEGVQYFEPCS